MPPRGKFSKPIRGGGKKFSRDVRPAEDAPGMWDDGPREKEESEEEDSEEEESEEEESGDDGNAGPSKPKLPVATADMSRDERKAAQKARKEAIRAQQAKGIASLSISDDEEEEEEEPVAKQPQKQPRGPPSGNLNAGNVEPTMSRREREAAEAAAAKERYRKLHEAGKTEEAKSDLARLALIRKEREEKAKQRAAELEEKKRQADVKAKASGKKLK